MTSAYEEFFIRYGRDIRLMARQLRVDQDEVLSEVICALAAPAVVAGRVISVKNWVFRRVRISLTRQVIPTAFISLDDEGDGIALSESVFADTVDDDKNIWQKADEAGLGHVCDALEGGTAVLADRLGVSRRRAQQIYKKAAEEECIGDLFCGVVR